MVIEPDGLFGGDRLAALSDKARWAYPWLLCAANGFGRIEFNPRDIIHRCFRSFADQPSEAQLRIIVSEYAAVFLLFAYQSGGRVWLQFDTSEKFLPRHKSKKDRESPDPPREAREAFEKGYLGWKRAKSIPLHDFGKGAELFHADVHGIGIGIGVGVGEKQRAREATESSASPESNPTPLIADPTQQPPPRVETPEQSAQPPDNPPEPLPVAAQGVREAPAAVTPLPVQGDASTLVRRIAIGHPRSLLRHTRFGEVRQVDQSAVLRAAEDESAATGLSIIGALEMILSRVTAQATESPPAKYQFFKDLPDYFRLHEYRLDTAQIVRLETSNGTSTRHGNNRGQDRTDRNVAAAEEADRIIERRLSAHKERFAGDVRVAAGQCER